MPDKLTAVDLQKKHADYDKNINDWRFYEKAYTGGKEFIKAALFQNERETKGNWETRIKEGICFNYAGAVVDIFNYFLHEKTVHRELGQLAEDEQWKMFVKDCNLEGTAFSDFSADQQKVASVYGMCGVLIDKPGSKEPLTDVQEVKAGLYPYAVPFSMPDIHDWKFTRNTSTGQLELSYLKLCIDTDRFSIWTKEAWEIWEIESDGKQGGKKANLVDNGPNPLGEIPFVWYYNLKSMFNAKLGNSDITNVSLIQASIARNISCGDEVIKYAGFPMLRMPMETEDNDEEDEAEGGKETTVSARSVLEFDPSQPDGKPDWLKAPVLEPIRAILEMIDRKTDEMYRTAHLAGIYNQRDKAQTKSGTALKYEFHQLNSVLCKKARNLTASEKQLIGFWLKWQKKDDWMDEIEIKRSDEFSIDELTETLENIITSIKIVKSQEFAKLMKKQILEKLSPNAKEETLKMIVAEIDAMVETFTEGGTDTGNEDESGQGTED